MMRAGPAALAGLGLGFGLAVLAGTFVSTRQQAPSLSACPAPTQAMARIELMFGLSSKRGEIDDAQWRAFLDAEITPRFPDGLTVLSGYGQWRGPDGRLTQEPSRMLLVWAKPSADNDGKIEAIRAAWKTRFEQDSVMRVEDTSCVSF